MTALRQRMMDAMVLRGFALRTHETYLACVTALARHYRKAPDRIDAQEIQAYLLHLIGEKKLAYASVNQAVCAFRFFYGKVLGRPELAVEIPMAKVPKRLPTILTRDEITRLFGAAADLRSRTVLMTTYAAGLRVSEVCALKLSDIESAPDRLCLKVSDRHRLASRIARSDALSERGLPCVSGRSAHHLWPGLSRHACTQRRAGEGVARHRRLSYRGPGRTHRVLRSLRCEP